MLNPISFPKIAARLLQPASIGSPVGGYRGVFVVSRLLLNQFNGALYPDGYFGSVRDICNIRIS